MAEQSFIAVKPDGVQRGLVGTVISRFETRGFKLVALKMVTASRELLDQHYDELVSKGWYGSFASFMSSGPMVAMIWEGPAVISTARDMIGATNPLKAVPGTVRGDYAVDSGRNLIHGSDSPESAKREISLWFTPAEIQKWTQANAVFLREKP